MLATAVVGAIIANDEGRSEWEVVGLAVVSGLLSLLLLWVGSFLMHLFLAPGRIRRLEAKPPLERRSATLQILIPPTVRKTEIAVRAGALVTSLRRFSEDRRKLLGRGKANEENLRRMHCQVLHEIELFGDLVKSERGESGRKSERREARLMYEAIRGFHITADLDLSQEVIRDFAKPPPEPLIRRRVWRPIRRWWMRLWIQVT